MALDGAGVLHQDVIPEIGHAKDAGVGESMTRRAVVWKPRALGKVSRVTGEVEVRAAGRTAQEASSGRGARYGRCERGERRDGGR